MIALLLAALVQNPSIEGTWSGTLETHGYKLRVAFRIASKDGKLSAMLDSIDQGVKGIAAESVEFQSGTVMMQFPSIGGAFTGRLEGESIEGTWSQSGVSLPLELRRVAKAPEPNRPQTPKPPFPYEVEEVAYENNAGGIRFAGTLTRPKGAGPFPAVLLITGSGAQDRDETLFEHKPFLVLADALTRHGFAVLRVDDRGVGGSSGDILDASMDDLVADALAGVAFLKTRATVDAKRIGLVGHSEGGWVAALAAARSKDVAIIVMIAGPGLGGEEILHLQSAAILRAGGVDKETIGRNRAVMERVYSAVKEESDNARARERLLEIFREQLAGLTEEQARAAGPQIEAQLNTLTSRWFRSILTYDPRPSLRQVICPILAILGEKDLQVPAAENKAALVKAFEEGGNKAARVEVLAGHNHLMQRCQTGLPGEYGSLEETMSPESLELITEWLRENLK